MRVRLLLPLCLVAALLGLATPASARPAVATPDGTVQVDPLTTALGFVHVQIERRLGETFSLYAGPSLRLYDSLLADEDEDFRGYGAEVGVRFFPRGGAPLGFWLQARGVLAYLTAADDRAAGGYASVLAGYTLLLRERWILSGGVGAQYLHYRVAGMGPEGPLPALHTTVGFAF